MSEENKKQEVNEAFAKTMEHLNGMRGGVKAFMILAMTDEPAKDGEKDAVNGISATGGKMADVVVLFENIDPKIKNVAAMHDLVGIMGKIANLKGKKDE